MNKVYDISIGLATESIPSNDKIRNHLVSNPIHISDRWEISFRFTFRFDIHLSSYIGGILLHNLSPSFTQLQYSRSTQVFRQETSRYYFLRRGNSSKIGTNFPSDPIVCVSCTKYSFNLIRSLIKIVK